MKSFKHDPALAELPAPVTLTPEQIAAVAGGTASALGSYLGNIHIAGGIPGPIYMAAISAPPTAI